MARWRFSPVRLGVWGMLVIVLAGVGRCGRDRENPVDPNYPGGGTLQPPGNIRAQGDIGRIQLTWDAVNINELAGYGVWRATSATGDYTRLRGESNDANVTTGRTVFVDSTMDVSASRIYFYRVTTVDVNGQSSERSAFVSAEVREDKRPPASPANLSAVRNENTGHIALVWDAPRTDADNQDLTGLDGYRVFRARDTEDSYVLIAAVPASRTTFTDTTGLDPDFRYFYQVSAVDRFDNESARSRSASVSTPETGIVPPDGLRTVSKVGKIELHWNASNDDNLLGYLVLRSTSTQAPFEPVSSNVPFTTAQTVYTDTDVQVDVVYFYRVQTVVRDPDRGIVTSDASPFVDGQAEPDESPPAAPSDLSVSLDDEDAGVVLLSWSPPTKDDGGDELTGLSHYRIFRSKETANSFVEMAQVPGTQTSFRDATVEPLTVYYYTVNAVDFKKNGGPRSAALSVSTPGLATPTRVTAIAGKAKISLAWAPNQEPKLTGYEVVRYSDVLRPDVFSTFITPWPAYVDTPLVGGKTYAYRVRALGPGGLSSRLSDFVLATVLDDDLAPAPPEFLYAKLSGNTDIELSWRASTTDEDGSELTGLSHYRIYRSEGTGSAGFAWIATVDSTNLTYVDSGLETSTTYIYQVRALDASGNESQASNSVSLETELDDDLAPAPPEFLHAELTGNTAIKLTWRAPTVDEDGSDLTGLSHYRIYRSEGTGSAGFAWIATVDSTNLTYVDPGLETSTTYIYQVRALDVSGNESQTSNSVSIETGSIRSVPKPTMVAAVVEELENQGLAVVVTWRAPVGVTRFGVYRQQAGSSSSNKFETLAFRLGDTKYIDMDIESGKTYIYRIVSLQGSSFSDPSDSAVVAVP
ncbi:MAG: hypothetical protein OXU79_06620 [Gemmatimonadota bacterium]|nr:hypothetical protein [Gemmatimonadota bacterium]